MTKNVCWKVGLTAVAVCLQMSSSWTSASTERVSMAEDGQIIVDGRQFTSLKEYVRSDYFREQGKRCGVRTRGEVDYRQQKAMADCTAYLTSIRQEYWPQQAYTLPVWWHVITKTDGTGNVSDAAIAAQMAVLNQDYRAMAGTMGANGYDVKIQFELAGITRTANNAWFTDSDAVEDVYKQALGRDPKRFVNIYTNFNEDGVLGYAYYPQGSAGQFWDGIVLLYGVVGGRNNDFGAYDQGRTLVHEMGHYLGLAHTFEGGCSNSYSSGDLIVDTPAEQVPHFDCAQTATCGTPDPIHNYMNYTDDVCMNRFTREQANRAVCSLVNYRPELMRTAQGMSALAPMLLPLLLDKEKE